MKRKPKSFFTAFEILLLHSGYVGHSRKRYLFILLIRYHLNPISYSSGILLIRYPSNPISYLSDIFLIRYLTHPISYLSDILLIRYPTYPISYISGSFIRDYANFFVQFLLKPGARSIAKFVQIEENDSEHYNQKLKRFEEAESKSFFLIDISI